ncbi:MAG: hypothetical protein ACFFDW_06490 [Candidatus Thorarchaeota archaeon]
MKEKIRDKEIIARLMEKEAYKIDLWYIICSSTTLLSGIFFIIIFFLPNWGNDSPITVRIIAVLTGAIGFHLLIAYYGIAKVFGKRANELLEGKVTGIKKAITGIIYIGLFIITSIGVTTAILSTNDVLRMEKDYLLIILLGYIPVIITLGLIMMLANMTINQVEKEYLSSNFLRNIPLISGIILAIVLSIYLPTKLNDFSSEELKTTIQFILLGGMIQNILSIISLSITIPKKMKEKEEIPFTIEEIFDVE